MSRFVPATNVLRGQQQQSIVARRGSPAHLRGVLRQQVRAADCRFAAQNGRDFQAEVVVARELQRGVFARKFVGRTAAAGVTDGRRVRTLLTRRRRGRRRRRRRGRGVHQIRLRGRQRSAGTVGRGHLIGYRLAHRVHLVFLLQILRHKKANRFLFLTIRRRRAPCENTVFVSTVRVVDFPKNRLKLVRRRRRRKFRNFNTGHAIQCFQQ